jgi:hypothetical protein
MKNKWFTLLVGLFFLGLMTFPGCKTADAQNYTLTVTLEEGVEGTPAAGSFDYEENAVVNYNYSLQFGYYNLVVTLDGNAVEDAGTITMNRNHTLNVTADAMVNLNGSWKGNCVYQGKNFSFSAHFGGGFYTGTVFNARIDTVTGTGQGPYTVTGNQIEFYLVFRWNTNDFTGTIDNPDHMSGDWAEHGGGESGTWYLDRQ